MRPCYCAVGVWVAVVAFASASNEPDYAQLVRQLGNPEYRLRVAAHQKLRVAGIPAKAAVERGIKDTDAEIVQRSALILAAVRIAEKRTNDRLWLSERLMPLFGAINVGPLPEVRQSLPASNTIDVLRWLAAQQSSEGHWDTRAHGAQVNADIEQTALVLLAFLGAGHTEKVGQFRFNVKSAVERLIKKSAPDGAFMRGGQPVSGIAQALASLALSEAAGMGNLPATKAAAQSAIDYCCESHQCGEGSARSGFGANAKSEKPDLLTTTLFALALKSAKIAGLRVPPESFEGITKYVDSVEDKSKLGFAYAPGEIITPSSTMLGLVCRQMVGYKREDLAHYAQSALAQYGEPGLEEGDVFTDWMASLVAAYQGGELWRKYDSNASANLMPADVALGYWEPKGEWHGAGRLFCTALKCLVLEVRYRCQITR